MKKLALIFTALMLSLSLIFLSACGKKDDKNKNDDPDDGGYIQDGFDTPPIPIE